MCCFSQITQQGLGDGCRVQVGFYVCHSMQGRTTLFVSLSGHSLCMKCKAFPSFIRNVDRAGLPIKWPEEANSGSRLRRQSREK